MNAYARIALFALLLVGLPSAAEAQRAHTHDEEHNHHVALTLGVERILDHDGETGFLIGGDIVRRIDQRLAFGAAADFVMADEEDVLKLFAGFSVSVSPDVSLFAAPGVEFAFVDVGEGEESEDETSYVQRVGVAWSAGEVGGWAVAPLITVDVTSGGHAAMAFALSFGRGF